MGDRSTREIVIGVVLVVAGLALVWSGLAPLSESWEARDGYFMSDPLTVDQASRAVVAEDVDLLRGRYETLTEETFLFAIIGEPDDVRMQGVASADGGLFMGIAPTGAVDAYLDGVAHDEIVEWGADQARLTEVEYTTHEGRARPGDPGSETFWVASVRGAGEQTMDWTIEPGEWTVVLMNEDASEGISAEVRFGTVVPANLDTVAWTVFAVGLVALIGGATLVYVGVRRLRRDPMPEGGVGNPAPRVDTAPPREPVGSMSRLIGLAVVALLVVVAVGVGACRSDDDSGVAVLTVVNLPDEVQGWRLRAEAFSADLDGSPTFYFSESEQVTGASMTSEETPLGPRSYVLKVELAEPSGETRTCEADLAIAALESVDLTLEAESLVGSTEAESPPACALSVERLPSE